MAARHHGTAGRPCGVTFDNGRFEHGIWSSIASRGMRRYARRTPSGSSRVRHAAGWLRVNMLGWQAVARAIAVIGETDSPRARIRAGTRMRIVVRHRPLGDSLASLPGFTVP